MFFTHSHTASYVEGLYDINHRKMYQFQACHITITELKNEVYL